MTMATRPLPVTERFLHRIVSGAQVGLQSGCCSHEDALLRPTSCRGEHGSGTAPAAALWTQHGVWAKAMHPGLLSGVTDGSRGTGAALLLQDTGRP